MKTNRILKSIDRELFGVIIPQQSKTEFLSVTKLQEAYNVARWQYGWHEKNLTMIVKTSSFKERVFHLLDERGLIKLSFVSFMDMIENEGVVKTLKGLKVWKTTGRGSNRQVMCDPYIWVLLSMEMNSLIYAKVIIWLTDGLIFNRNYAGDRVLPMNSKIGMIIKNPKYGQYATLINQAVFGYHKSGMRDAASSEELKQISKIEDFVIMAIDNEMISTEKELLAFLEKQVKERTESAAPCVL